jgi:hypothetical protein
MENDKLIDGGDGSQMVERLKLEGCVEERERAGQELLDSARTVFDIVSKII